MEQASYQYLVKVVVFHFLWLLTILIAQSITIYVRKYIQIRLTFRIDANVNHPTDIYNTEADIRSPGSYELLNETNYHENPLNVSEFVQIEIQLELGKHTEQ